MFPKEVMSRRTKGVVQYIYIKGWGGLFSHSKDSRRSKGMAQQRDLATFHIGKAGMSRFQISIFRLGKEACHWLDFTLVSGVIITGEQIG